MAKKTKANDKPEKAPDNSQSQRQTRRRIEDILEQRKFDKQFEF
ncbi:PA3496 family putative envelope integrity protein [Photobacterium ganghwense]|nr:adenosine deaminase [Photobacterium ganghwense]PSU07463.1 adenosine deaminase [Photobacterium ganghwense]QSV16198.1 adenosine deaminase [Photobacterium ganghwense]